MFGYKKNNDTLKTLPNLFVKLLYLFYWSFYLHEYVLHKIWAIFKHFWFQPFIRKHIYLQRNVMLAQLEIFYDRSSHIFVVLLQMQGTNYFAQVQICMITLQIMFEIMKNYV